MYVFEHYATSRDEYGELHGPWVTTLWEMSAKELRVLTGPGADPLIWYEPIAGATAHAWVRQDGHHNTPLYIDCDGRVRYARDAS